MGDRRGWSRPALVLIASAHEWASRSLDSILTPNVYSVVRVYTGRDAVARARTLEPDVVILDMDLVDLNGLEACRMLRAGEGITASTPILMMMGVPITRQRTLESLRAGANALWGQPLDVEEFLLRLEGLLRSKLDADRAREDGLVDHATGLYNRRGLARRAQELAWQATRVHAPLACVALALDLAPATTAPDGGAADAEEREGSARALARALDASRRVSDTVGRLGPTEFAVLAPHTDAAGAAQLGARLTEAVEHPEAGWAPGAPRLRVRAGYEAVADFAQAPLDPLALLARAASALRAPAGGGSRVRRFESGGDT